MAQRVIDSKKRRLSVFEWIEAARLQGVDEETIRKMVLVADRSVITIEEAAERANVSLATVYYWVKKDYLHKYDGPKGFFRTGQRIMIDADELAELLKDPPKQGKKFSKRA